MPPRALRKLQRQQEEQNRLAELEKSAGAQDEESEEEGDIKPANTRQRSAFELLNESLEDDDEDAAEEVPPDDTDGDDEAAKAGNDNVSIQKEVSAGPAKPKKKKKSKKKGKAAKSGLPPTGSGQKEQDSELDEIDLALKDLKVKNEGKAAEPSQSTVPAELQAFYKLLSVDTKNLKVLNEMKRLFGSSVLDSESEGAGAGRRRGRGPQQLDLGAALDRRNNPLSRGQGLSERVLRKNIFIQGKDGWLRETGGGLGMELVEQAEDFTTEYRYVHSPSYHRSQREFDIAVESMDPQQVISFLHYNPYHISGLLQVSEIAKQHQEPAVAVDLLERALFSFGRAAHSSFATAMAEGKARLDFRRPENRELWLAAWRYVRSLGQRGTWRTAYEWAKLLFSLDPEGDPYQIRLVIDQLAIRAGQFEQLVHLANMDPHLLDWGQGLPNIQISLALAHNRLKHPIESRAILARAVQHYPWIIARLLTELDIGRLPKSVWGQQPRTPREELHAAAYVAHAKDLWNTPEAVSLLVEVAETTDALPTLPAPDTAEIDLSEARHIILDETPALIGLLPRHYTSARTSASDPLPPDDNLPTYPDSHADADGADADADDSDAARGADSALRSWAQRVMGVFSRQPAADVAAETNTGTAAAGPRGSDSDSDSASDDDALGPRTARTAAADDQRLAEHEDAMLAEALRRSQAEHEARLAAAAAAPPDPSPPPAPAAPSAPPPDAAPDLAAAAPPAPSDDDPQRVPRWLAGRGLVALKAFCAAHGTDEGAWGFSLASEAAAPVRTYVEAARGLAAGERRFIVESHVPQGAGREVGELVKRLVGL